MSKVRQQFKAEISRAESTGIGMSWTGEGQTVPEGKARSAPPPHHPKGWRSRCKGKPQNLVSNLLVIVPPLDISFHHALGGFFSSLCCHPLFPFSCSIPLSLSPHFLGLAEQIFLLSSKKFMLLHRILPLSNDRVAFLKITRWSGAHHGNTDFPQLLVIFFLTPVLTSSYLFPSISQAHHPFLWG